MGTFASRLPSVMGSFAALTVTFLSFMGQVTPITCLMRAITAFIVFCAFGIIIRYILNDALEGKEEDGMSAGKNNFEHITPGTRVNDLLSKEEEE